MAVPRLSRFSNVDFLQGMDSSISKLPKPQVVLKQQPVNFDNGLGGTATLSGSSPGMARLSNPDVQARLNSQIKLNADPAFQSRMAEQNQIVNDRMARSAQPTQLSAEESASAQNKAQNMAMFGGGVPQLGGRSQEMQMAMDKARSQIAGGSGLDIKYGQKLLETLMANEAAQQQNDVTQQGNMLDLQKARESNQITQQNNESQRGFEQQQMQDKFGLDVKLKQMELENKANAPLNEMQQARIDDLKFKQDEKLKDREMAKATLQSDLNTSLGNAESFLKNIDRLSTIQGKTGTGQIEGSDTMAWLKKAAGGTDLEQLDKGYADLLIQNLGVYKAMGSSLGVNPTDKDIALLKNTVPQITNSELSNQQSLAKMKMPIMEQYNRSIEAARLKGLSTEGMIPFSDKDFAKVRAGFDPTVQQGQQGNTATQPNPALNDRLKAYGY